MSLKTAQVLATLFLAFSNLLVIHAQTGHVLQVTFTNIEEESGSLYIQLMDKNEEVVSSHIIDAKEGAILKVNNLPSGQYWLRVYQDLNGNEELDANYIGIPKEPYGFSNNVRPRFGPPDTEDMLFSVKANTNISIELQ
jgi:uncharacterized protein (DUF2141 family)